MVKGYSQRCRIDYEEVFAPVARFESIRVLMALSAQGRWKLHICEPIKRFYCEGKRGLCFEIKEGFI